MLLTKFLLFLSAITPLMRWLEINPKTPKPPCFVCVQSFVLRFDLIASDVNQCDSLIGKSRLIGFDWSPAKLKPFERVDWILTLIININCTYNSNQNIQDWVTLELAIRIRNAKGYSDISEASWRTLLIIWWGYSSGLEWLKRGDKRRNNGEAKPRPYFSMKKTASGRLLEVQSQAGGNLVQALPAISAIGGLWGTKCARWPTLAALTTAV